MKKKSFRLLLIISILLLLFQSNIEKYVPLVGYYDELLPIFLIVLSVIQENGKVKLSNIKKYLILFALILIGVVGNIRSQINAIPFIMLVDALGIIKFFLTVIIVKSMLNYSECSYVIEKSVKIFQVYLFAAAITYIPATLLEIEWMFPNDFMGIGTYGFISGAGGLGYYLISAFCLFEFYGKKLKLKRFTRTLCIIMIISTLKGPALLFVAFLFFYYIFLNRGKMRWYHILPLILLGTVVGWNKIQVYLLSGTSARAILHVTALKIARDYFPIGMGLATFGSEMSRRYYSDAYRLYGVNQVWGLSIDHSMYINDNYWAMVIAQFGFLGTIIVALQYYNIYQQINSKQGCTIQSKYAVLAMFFTFMAGSLGSAYLTNSIAVLSAIVFGIYLNKEWINDNEVNLTKSEVL